MIVGGIDSSLTGLGAAKINLSSGETLVREFKSKGTNADDLQTRLVRIQGMADDVILFLHDCDHVAIEQPAYDSRTGKQHDRSGLWWELVRLVDQLGATMTEVRPQEIKQYTLGKASGAKDAVLAAVVRRYLDVEITSNNTADAFVLAAMLARHLGLPIEEALAQVYLKNMAVPHWAVPAPVAPR